MAPHLVLGVPLMDADHGRLEEILATGPSTPDAALRSLFSELETEIRAHFDREEELMKAHGLPIYSCHVVQHRLFLRELDHGREAVARDDMDELRQFLTTTLPRLLAQHVDTVDRVTASFLRSAIDESSTEGLPRAAGVPL